jgi:hypothetical protein
MIYALWVLRNKLFYLYLTILLPFTILVPFLIIAPARLEPFIAVGTVILTLIYCFSIASQDPAVDRLLKKIAIKRHYIDATESDAVHYILAEGIVRRGLAGYAVVYYPINIGAEFAGSRRVLSCNEIEEPLRCCTSAILRGLGIENIDTIACKEAIGRFARDRERYFD